MTIENHRSGLFDSLALPAIHETYRNIIFKQLYDRFDTSPMDSMCWAYIEKSCNNKSNIVVLPGEERFLIERYGTHFSYLNRKAYSCPYHREETNVNVNDDGSVNTRKPHFCSMPVVERPLMCRAMPFGIRRTANPRKMSIVAHMPGLKSIYRRRGSVVIDQIMHNVIQLAISLWSFLTDAWWEYYNKSYADVWKFESVCDVEFTLTDDVIMSNIRGAPPMWKTQILAQMANPECIYCEGKGIEFWDRSIDGKVMFSVKDRRFDICRHCVAGSIGAVFDNMLVNPTSRKVLTNDGKEYRGDTILKKDM